MPIIFAIVTEQQKSLFTELEIERARNACRQDPFVNEICQLIGAMYKNQLPVDVDVFWTGQVKLIPTGVMQMTVNQLRTNMRTYIQQTYPALSYMFAPIQVDGNVHTWSDPVEKPAGYGEFLVITEYDYCIKAIHYGKNDWQIDNRSIEVLLWRPLPDPPPGKKYRTEGVLTG